VLLQPLQPLLQPARMHCLTLQQTQEQQQTQVLLQRLLQPLAPMQQHLRLQQTQVLQRLRLQRLQRLRLQRLQPLAPMQRLNPQVSGWV
jgi:hypothetical protein